MFRPSTSRRKKHTSFSPLNTGMHWDEFEQFLLPWLIGVPISLIIIRVFSL